MDPQTAYYTARDEGPSDYTREIVCKDAFYSYSYALRVDGCPFDNTRKGACKKSYWAYRYAKDIDKYFRIDTCLASCKDGLYLDDYTNWLFRRFNKG